MSPGTRDPTLRRIGCSSKQWDALAEEELTTPTPLGVGVLEGWDGRYGFGKLEVGDAKNVGCAKGFHKSDV